MRLEPMVHWACAWHPGSAPVLELTSVLGVGLTPGLGH